MPSKADLLEYACDQGMEGFALHDNEGNFTYVNPAQARMYGYEPSELIGESWRTFYDDDEARRIDTECFPQLINNGSWMGEVVGLKKDGTTFDVEVSLSQLVDEHGDPIGLVCNCRDVTDRKKTEAQVRQLQRLESLGQLTSGVAHDFNNVLAVLLGSLEMTLNEPLDDKSRELLNLAMDATRQGVSLANRLLAFSKQQALQPESVNPGLLLERLRPMLSAGLGDGVELVIECEDGAWNCLADPGELENAIVNLALNGRDAMPDGGRLTVSVFNHRHLPEAGASHQSVHQVGIRVADTGIGIREGDLSRIFDPFFTTKPAGEGSGLGLSMVYGFANQTGGSVVAESEEGCGSQFTLYLPRDFHQTERPIPPRRASTKQRYRSVLVVEDDPGVRSVVSLQLQQLGCEVDEVKDYVEAMSSLQGANFDLVLSDISLPGSGDGVSLAQHVLQTMDDTRVLLMSGEITSSVPKHMQIIHKPFTTTQLESKLLELDA